MPALQAQTSQLGADRVTAIPEMARDLRGALSYGPEHFEQRYVFRIPTHGRYLYADSQLQDSRLPDCYGVAGAGIAHDAAAIRKSRRQRNAPWRQGACQRASLRATRLTSALRCI